MEREVRYCMTEDGVRIAYCVEGDGPPLVVCPAFVESFSGDHLFPELADFLKRIGRDRRIVRYDMRGTGLSEREVTDLSHHGLVLDLSAVVAAIGAEHCSIYASTLSGPRALEYAASQPDHVDKIVLHGTFARASAIMPIERVESLANLARLNWEMAAQSLADATTRQLFPEFGVRMASLYRQSTSGEIVSRLFLQNIASTDVTGILSKVRASCLVLHRVGDELIPFAQAEILAEGLSGAKLVVSEGSVHHLVLGESRNLLAIIAQFLAGSSHLEGRDQADLEPLHSFRSVLFTASSATR